MDTEASHLAFNGTVKHLYFLNYSFTFLSILIVFRDVFSFRGLQTVSLNFFAYFLTNKESCSQRFCRFGFFTTQK